MYMSYLGIKVVKSNKTSIKNTDNVTSSRYKLTVFFEGTVQIYLPAYKRARTFKDG